MRNFAGLVAVVTGGASGIGTAPPCSPGAVPSSSPSTARPGMPVPRRVCTTWRPT